MKTKYNEHRQNAYRRKIEFNLTYDEWMNIWLQSGHWQDRGRGAGKYVMCRYGDVGPYAIGNVYIGTQEHNGYVANVGRQQDPSSVVKRSKALKNKKKTSTAIKNNALAQLQRPKYNCPHCNKNISGMGNVKQHIASKHGNAA